MQETIEQLRQNHDRYMALCEKSGGRAREFGLPQSKCPFARRSDAWRAWRQGWHAEDRKEADLRQQGKWAGRRFAKNPYLKRSLRSALARAKKADKPTLPTLKFMEANFEETER